jgi:hypothetical protein
MSKQIEDLETKRVDLLKSYEALHEELARLQAARLKTAASEPALTPVPLVSKMEVEDAD